MKLTMKYKVSMVVMMACIFSCTKPGDVDLPLYKPQLVLHAYIPVGDTFKIALGKTLPQQGSVPDEDDTYVTNGLVVLYENNTLLDTLRFNAQENRYVSASVVAAAGKTYRITAAAPGFDSIEAITSAPQPVGTVSVVRKEFARRTAGGNWLDDIKFSINDPASERNFYITTINSPTQSIACVYTYEPAIEQHTVNLAPFEQGNCMDSDAIQYTDNTFNGSLKEITVSLDGRVLEIYQDASGKIYRPYLERYHVTEDHYRYFKSAMDQDFILEEGPSFLEPRTIRGNVKNGFGLFAVYSVVTDTIR